MQNFILFHGFETSLIPHVSISFQQEEVSALAQEISSFQLFPRQSFHQIIQGAPLAATASFSAIACSAFGAPFLHDFNPFHKSFDHPTLGVWRPVFAPRENRLARTHLLAELINFLYFCWVGSIFDLKAAF